MTETRSPASLPPVRVTDLGAQPRAGRTFSRPEGLSRDVGIPNPEQRVELGNTFRVVRGRCYGHPNGGNALVLGENLHVLQHLASRVKGRVRCVYLDPPYNNQEDWKHFSDSRSHDEWLRLITDRLEATRPLLSEDGSIWVSIDDREAHYLKIAMDEVFGRESFLATIVWQQRTTRENRRAFSVSHEYLLVYATNPRLFTLRRNRLSVGSAFLSRYRNPDGDARGPWQSVSVNAQDGHATSSQFYPLVAPNGRVHYPPKGRAWVYTRERMDEEIRSGNIWFGTQGDGVPRRKRFLADTNPGLTPETLWKAEDVGTSDEAKKQLLELFPSTPLFDTPKPERLIARIIEIATNKGDIVLDPYLGSGTTAAVAQKMGRTYIGVEQNPTAMALSLRRLRLVVDGDQTGCSAQAGWTGGGGFEAYRITS